VLAQLAQSCELKLLHPVVQLAETTDQFSIMLWLHGGFHVDFRDPSKAARWKARIEQAVQEEADRLGVATSLDSSI
jgi:hypothetical protein